MPFRKPLTGQETAKAPKIATWVRRAPVAGLVTSLVVVVVVMVAVSLLLDTTIPLSP